MIQGAVRGAIAAGAALLLGTAGCGGDSSGDPDAQVDGGPGDGGPGDGGSGDGGPARDGGTPDAMAADAGGGDAGEDAAPGGPCEDVCGTPGCGRCPDAGMVEVRTPDGAVYAIDRTEVTNAQYAAFLRAEPSTEDQPMKCFWNESFAPSTSFFDCFEEPFEPEERPSEPVSCIDWCDAFAYCKWARKELCGKVGGGRLDADREALHDPEQSEWYNACSLGGRLTFPYGDTWEEARCVDSHYDGTGGYDPTSDKAQPVGTAARCRGAEPPFDRIVDMSGNVREWTQMCTGIQPDAGCWIRGGSYKNARTSMSCETRLTLNRPRDNPSNSVGFRCCRE